MSNCSKRPHTWAQGTLDDAVHIVRGISFPSSAKLFSPASGLIACLRTANVQENVDWDDLWFVPEHYIRNPDQVVMTNDVLISTANSLELVGKVAQVRQTPCRATLGAFISLLRPEPSLDARFIFYQLSAAEYQAAIRSTASTTTNISNVSTEKLRILPFWFAPRGEQDRIANDIDTQFTHLGAGIAALKRVQANLKRYRAAVLKAACEGRLVPTEAELARRESRSYETGEQLLARILQERRAKWEADQLAKMLAAGKPPRDDSWKEKYKEPEPPDTSNLTALPEGWTWATADQCTTVITDGEHITPPRTESGVLLLSARNIRDGSLSLDVVDYVSEDTFLTLSRRLRIETGDVLLSCSGSVGRSCTAPANFRFCLVRSVAVLKPVGTMGAYLSLLLRSPLLQSQIREKQTQTAQSNIFQGKIKRLLFPISPFSEQSRIVAAVEMRFEALERLENELKHAFHRADRLRKSILKRAFEGKLVPQDPNDEPASVLLERIRAERQNQAAMNGKPVRNRTTRKKAEAVGAR